MPDPHNFLTEEEKRESQQRLGEWLATISASNSALCSDSLKTSWLQRDEGDTIFIEYIGIKGSLRLALPTLEAISKMAAQQMRRDFEADRGATEGRYPMDL